MLEFLFAASALALVPVLALILVVKLDDGEGWGDRGEPIPNLTGHPRVDVWLSRVRPWHLAYSLAWTATFFAAAFSHFNGPWIFLAALLFVILFVRAWRFEFLALMAQPDDAFPGRHDKLIWVALLFLMPPVGYLTVRAYRRSMAGEAAPHHPKPAPVRDLA